MARISVLLLASSVLIESSLSQITDENITEITIFAISNVNDTPSGKAIIGGQMLAMDTINNNSNLLPNYKLNIEVFDSKKSRSQAVKHALNITTQYRKQGDDPNRSIFPLILGSDWSSLSTTIAPVVEAYDMGQLSASATSIKLEQTYKYENFYRTIPSDSLQARGIIALCHEFGWDNIAVVYVDDEYGDWLNRRILELAENMNEDSSMYIEVESIAVSEDIEYSEGYEEAAEQIKDLEVYIIVLILHDAYIDNFFHELGKFPDLLEYPYFYIGVDGWFDDAVIEEHNISHIAAGFIGTIPWQPNTLNIDYYDDEIKDAVRKAEECYANITQNKLWPTEYFEEEDDVRNNFMIYGYDAMYTLAYIMQDIADNPGDYGNKSLMEWLNDTADPEEREDFMTLIHNTMVDNNKINFYGPSGNVVFNEDGDRINGLYSFGNALKNGSVKSFGYFYEDANGTFHYKMNNESIIWPKSFEGRQPRSAPMVITEEDDISIEASIIVSTLSIISAVIAFACIIILIVYRNNNIIKGGSWRLNILICIGALLAYWRVILYSIDESMAERWNMENPEERLDILCNVRTWLLCISFTLLFMPLFAKTYRLSRIFDGVLSHKKITDTTLFMIIFGCVIVDVVLLSVWTWKKPLKRYHQTSDLEQVDDIGFIMKQKVYCACAFEEDKYFGEYYFYVYGSLLVWKLIQALWGIHAYLNVSKIRIGSHVGILNKLRQFDETGVQSFSLLFTFICCLIATTIFCIGVVEQKLLVHYVVMVVCILLVVNVIIALNVLPRIIAVTCYKKTAKFKKSPDERMRENVEKELIRLGWVYNEEDGTYTQRGSESGFSFSARASRAKSKFVRSKNTNAGMDRIRYSNVRSNTINKKSPQTPVPTLASVPIQLKPVNIESKSDDMKDIGSEEENAHLVYDESDLKLRDDTSEKTVESVKEMLVSINEYDEFENEFDKNASGHDQGNNSDLEMTKMWNEEAQQIESK